MSYINIKSVVCIENRINIEFESSADLSKYFKDKFYLEFNEKIDNVPESIAVIPFVANVLPLIWLTDSTLRVPQLDNDFYNSISEFKVGYEKMYPDVSFRGKVDVNKLERNKFDNSNKSAVLFSGGLDAYHTLIRHLDERPDLITVFGADLHLYDVEGWEEVKKTVKITGAQYDLKNVLIETSFVDYLDQTKLNEDFGKIIHGTWYHNVQHGIGLLCLCAPYIYIHKIDTLYIASSYYQGFPGHIYCASDDSIDSNVRFASTKVVHDAYNSTRQDKILDIIKFSETRKIQIPLRVCWFVKDGKNCCGCEKCFRTIMGIIAEGRNPNNYGLPITTKTLKDLQKFMTLRYQCGNVDLIFWEDIKRRFRANKRIIESSNKCYYKNTKWIYNFNFRDLKKNRFYIEDKYIKIGASIICKILPRRIKTYIKKFINITALD